MSESTELNRHQRRFLKKLRDRPTQLPEGEWPRPATLERWMARAPFRRAMRRVSEAFQVQSDLQLAVAAACASATLQDALQQSVPLKVVAERGPEIAVLVKLLQVSHWRARDQRAAADARAETAGATQKKC